MGNIVISLHDVGQIKADTPGTLGAPLMLTLLDNSGDELATITLFLGSNNWAARLADAITDAGQGAP